MQRMILCSISSHCCSHSSVRKHSASSYILHSFGFMAEMSSRSIGEQFEMRYLDPLGGAILSLYSAYYWLWLNEEISPGSSSSPPCTVIIEWTRTLLENVVKLTGKRASPGQHQVRHFFFRNAI